jgi:Lsr2 protein
MTRLVDDIDGSHAVTTLSFSLDGRSYEIDLSESHLSALQEALAPFITAARAVPNGRGPVRTPAPRRAPAPNDRPAPTREVIAAEPATRDVIAAEPVAARPVAVDTAPFRQPAPGRNGTTARSKAERAPLVADPFKPRS